MAFYGENVFLQNGTAKALYGKVKDLQLYDYHCHMTAKDIYEDREFSDIGELWLAADHYKWHAMRQCGIDEKYITGDAPYEEKFKKYASIMPLLANNQLYHWSHMELQRVFGISIPLSAETADEIYAQANAVIREKHLSPRRMLELFDVELVCTTDDPLDSLEWHEKLKGQIKTRVLPAFRPDFVCTKFLDKGFPEYIKKLNIVTFEDFLDAMRARLDYFIAHGCGIADHGISFLPESYGNHTDAASAFERRMHGGSILPSEADRFADYMLRFFMNLYAEKGIVMQMHMAPLRNINSKKFAELGPDTGYDTVGNPINSAHLIRILDRANNRAELPKTIFYSLNDTQDTMIASVVSAFSEKVPGKMQLGAAWWFNDHRDGIEKQLKTYASVLPLGNFVGMLTDSRSFTSYSRFDYFRRILCNLLGKWVEAGELDKKAAETIALRICYENAKEYFKI